MKSFLIIDFPDNVETRFFKLTLFCPPPNLRIKFIIGIPLILILMSYDKSNSWIQKTIKIFLHLNTSGWQIFSVKETK